MLPSQTLLNCIFWRFFIVINCIWNLGKGPTLGKDSGATRWEPARPRVSERRIFDLKGPPKTFEISVLWISLHCQCTSRRFVEILSEPLSEEGFPLGDSRTCSPHRVALESFRSNGRPGSPNNSFWKHWENTLRKGTPQIYLNFTWISLNSLEFCCASLCHAIQSQTHGRP